MILASAERLAEEALQIGTDAGQPDAPLVYGVLVFAVRIHQDRADEIVELVQASVDANPRISAWRAGLAYVYCLLGRTTEAAAIIELDAKDRFAHVPHDGFRLTTLGHYATAAFQTGDRDAARVLYELMEPWRDQVVWFASGTWGHARTHLGLLAATLGWKECADKHFAIACEIQEGNGMLLWAANARLGWAEALARHGETDRARRRPRAHSRSRANMATPRSSGAPPL